MSAEICGRTSGDYGAPWTYRVSWRCVGCILPERSERPVLLYYEGGVREGAVPTWDISAGSGPWGRHNNPRGSQRVWPCASAAGVMASSPNWSA